MMKIKLKRIIFLLVVSLLSFSVSIQSLASSARNQSFTLNQISKISTIVLNGKNPSYTLYLPVMQQWTLNRVRMQLDIQYSPILLPSSTLTVMVNDIPVDTIKLAKNTNSFEWQLNIPDTLIKSEKGIINVRLIGYLKISDKICSDIENQGNWLTISGNSSVTYSYDQSEAAFKLKDLPQPFINKQSPGVDQITLFLPEKLTLERFSPYLKLVNYFSKEASWRGVSFGVSRFQGFDKIDQKQNAIVIGTPDAIDYSTIEKHLPLKLTDGRWKHRNGNVLPTREGFIYLTTNSQDSQKALMVISANDVRGITTVLDNINQQSLYYKANNPDFYIAKPLGKQKNFDKEQPIISLQHLGYGDGIVFGDGQQNLSYQFNLTADNANRPVNLLLRYSHSPFLSTDIVSYMMVTLNGFPLDGVSLIPGNAQKSSMEIILPKSALKLGKNTLGVTFDLRLQEKDCSRFDLSRAWGVLYNSSYLTFHTSDEPVKLHINEYPYILDKEVEIGLPQDPGFYNNSTTQKALIQFVSSLKDSSSLKISTNQSLSDKDNNRNIIYIGSGPSTNMILLRLRALTENLAKQLAITSNKAFKSIDMSLFINAFVKSQNVGFVGFVPLSARKSALILYGYDRSALLQALAMLNNSNKRDSLSANLAVAFNNGSFTSLSTEEIQKSIAAEIKVREASAFTVRLMIWVAAGIIVLIIVVVVILSIYKRR